MSCEICDSSVHTDSHHIVSKSLGGSNQSHNIAKLCPNCHRQVHLGEIVIEGRFNSMQGNVLVWRNASQSKIIPALPDPEVYLMCA